MMKFTDIRSRAVRKLRDLGTLFVATAIVLSVCGVALASMSGAQGEVPSPISGLWRRTPVVERTSQAHIQSAGITKPVTMIASIDVEGWKDRSDRVVAASVASATAVGEDRSQVTSASSVAVAHVLAQSLKGRHVLASVTRSAAEGLPDRGAATVGLVAVPNGDTVALLIDRVISPVSVGEKQSVPKPLAPRVSAVDRPVVDSVESPHVDSLSSYWGRPGTVITMRGSRFGATQAGSWLRCAGAKADIVSWTDTQIVFVVPAGAIEPGYVGVYVNAASSNGLYFVPSDKPTVTSISPREGAPGTLVTIAGSNFGAAQRRGWVSFAGASGEVVSWSDTEIRVIVPRSGLAGYAGVVANGLSSNGILYAPYGLPYIRSASTRRLTRGDGIVVSGDSFGSDSGQILIGSARITPDQWTDDRITFTVPAGVRSGYLGILREGMYTSNGVWVNVVPRMVAVSNWWAAPGSEIVLTGVGFEPSSGDYVVTVGGMPAEVLSWEDSSIRVRVPQTAPNGYVGVGTRAASSNGIHLVVETKARLTAMSPRTAAAGERITLTGTDFGAASPARKVLIGGVTECAIESWSETQIVALVPAGAPSGYLGVIKHNVSSNGVWLSVAP